MVQDVSVEMYAGSLVWWKASLADKLALQSAMGVLGMRVTFREVKPEVALMQAVTSVYYSHPSHHKGQLIRKADAPNGSVAVVVVREERGPGGNKYESTTRFELNETDWFVTSDGADHVRLSKVQSEVERLRGKVMGREVGTGLGHVLEEIGATQLRDGAKIYFVPAANMPRYLELARVFEEHLLPVSFLKTNCPIDSDTAAGIADNATATLRAEFEIIIAELETVDTAAALADNGGKLAERRAKLVAKLDDIKMQAAKIDAGFRGLCNIAGEIGNEIDSALALAILSTSL